VANGKAGLEVSGRVSSPQSSLPEEPAGRARLRLRSRALLARLRRMRLLWLILLPILLLAGVTLAMQAFGIVTWDAPAHLYKIALVHNYRAFFWDNNWYGGAYQVASYGFIFYWLAQFVSYKLLVVVSAGLMPFFFYLYLRRSHGTASYLPAVVLAGVLAIYLINGQDPFVLAMSLMMLGMVLLAYRQPLVGAVITGIAIFTNPLAFITGAVFLIAEFISRPDERRRFVRFAFYLLPFVIVRILLGVVFAEQATYVYPYAEVIHFAGFGMLGFFLARMSIDPARGAKQVFFLTYAAVACLLAFIPNNPVGSNIGRVFFLFGLPLVLDIRKVYAPKWITVPVILGVAVGQLTPPMLHYFHMAEIQSTKPAFFAPALGFANQHYDPNYRFHVVALDTHWEAYYFSIDGYAITRGWYRQADALHNQVLTGQFDAAQYVAWLKSMGVKYIFLPHAPLDWSGPKEASILASSAQFTEVFTSPDWTIYRLRHPRPMAVSLDGTRDARVVYMDHASLYLKIPAPGRYLIKVSYSPFWEVIGGVGTLSADPSGFLVLQATGRGLYGLRVNVTLAESLHQLSP
jgi:hypothetical protein